jgi:hypothetical protein
MTNRQNCLVTSSLFSHESASMNWAHTGPNITPHIMDTAKKETPSLV